MVTNDESGATGIDHDEAWDAIPWLVNGTVAGERAARLERHVAGCAACSGELGRQRRLREAIVRAPVAPSSSEASWRGLESHLPSAHGGSARPDRSVDARTRRRAVSGRTVRSRIARRVRRAPATAFGAVAASLCLAVVVLVAPGEGYRTLTDPAARAAGPGVEIRVRPAPGSEGAAVREALEVVGATRVEMSSPSGLVRALVPAVQRESALKRLRSDPLFLVVTTD